MIGYRLSPIPRRRLYLILTGLLINSIIFSASFTFFTSFSRFSENFLGQSEDTIVIYNPLANSIFTGTVPTHLSPLISEIPGVVSSPEVLSAGMTVDGKLLTVRGVSSPFFEIQPLMEIDGEVDDISDMECIIGFRANQRLDKNVGDYIMVRSARAPTLYDFKIVGVFRSDSPLDNELIVPVEYARLMSGLPLEMSTLIRVKLGEGSISEEKLVAMVTENHLIRVQVTSDSDFESRLDVQTATRRLIESHPITVPGELNLSLPLGDYILRVEGVQKSVSLREDTSLDFMVSRDLNMVIFNVYNGTTGEPVESYLQIKNILDGNTESVKVPESGLCETFLPDGDYLVTVKGHSKRIHIQEDVEVNLPLGPIPLHVIVLDSLNRPLPEALITVMGPETSITTHTDTFGNALLYLREAEYNITVLKGFAKSLQLYHSHEQTVLFTLDSDLEEYKLIVNVSWSNDTIAEYASISIMGEGFSYIGVSDIRGQLILYNLQHGNYTIFAEKNGLTASTEVTLDGDKVVEIILPLSIDFDRSRLSPEWVRYLPQSVTIGYSDEVLRNSMKVLVSLMTSILFILASIFTLTTVINSLDIIQNSINESSQSIGIIRSLGATRVMSARIIGGSLLVASIFTGLFGYFIGYGLVAWASRYGVLSLSGYVLEPIFSPIILVVSIFLCMLSTAGGLYARLGMLLGESPMTLLKGLKKSEIFILPKVVIYPLLAFFIAFIVRAVPEIIVWPYSVGYDTVASYIPTLMKLQTGFESQVLELLHKSPFFWIIASLPYPFDGVMPFKFFPVLLHGLLGVSIYIYSREAISDNLRALMIAILSTVYFIPLRVSWDLYEIEMGLVLVFLSLTIISRGLDNWSNRLLAFLVVIVTVLTNEASSIILFFCSIPSLISAIKLRNKKNIRGFLLVMVPTLLYFIYRIHILDIPLLASPVSLVYPSQTYRSLFKSVSTLYLYALLPLLPLALFGVRSMKRSSAMAYWLTATSAAALSPLYSPSYAIVQWDKWVYMTAYPLCFYAVEGLNVLTNFKIRFKLDREHLFSYGSAAGWLFTIILLLMSVNFIEAAPGLYPAYNSLYGKETVWIDKFIPSSMLLSTVPQEYSEQAIAHIEWLNGYVNDSSILLIDEEIEGYASFYIDRDKIMLHDLGEPWYINPDYKEDAVNVAREYAESGYEVYLITRNLNIKNLEVIKRGTHLSIYRYIQ